MARSFTQLGAGVLMPLALVLPELVEFHDGKLSSIVLNPDGSGKVNFLHLAVYEPRAHELYDVVSYQAELLLTGLHKFSCDEFPGRSHLISMLRHGDEEMSSVVATQLIKKPVSGRISIVFTTGARISFECDSMSLRLGSRNRVLEVWEGAL